MNKMMRSNISEALEEVVYPKLVEIEEKIQQSESKITTRIDNLAKVVTETKTSHEKRIKKIEEHVGFLPL